LITRMARITQEPFDPISVKNCMKNLKEKQSSGVVGRRKGRLALFLDQDLDILPAHADGITARLDFGTIGPGPIGQTKAPPMPRTRDNPIAHFALAERPAHVQTNVIEGKEQIALAKNADEFIPHCHRLGTPGWYVRKTSDGLILCHNLFWKTPGPIVKALP